MSIENHPIVVEAAVFMRALRDAQYPPHMPAGLADLLDCPYFGDSRERTVNIAPSTADVIAARQFILPKLFESVLDGGQHSDHLSVLAGLGRSNCWGSRLGDMSQAYELIQVLLDFVDCYWGSCASYAIATPDVLKIFNAWLKPSIPWTTLPGVRSICIHAFGDAWCAFVLPEKYDNRVGVNALNPRLENKVRHFIGEQRPPFLSGLCPAQDASDSPLSIEVLPDLSLR